MPTKTPKASKAPLKAPKAHPKAPAPSRRSVARSAAPSHVFGYGRVSTVEQTTDTQRREIEAFLRHDLADACWFTDTVSGSAHTSQRPGFQALLDKLRQGDMLAVLKLDRLGRDPVDIEQTLDRLEALGVSVKVAQLGDTDLTSSAGKLIRRILGAVAAMERDLIAERTKEALSRIRAEGGHVGRRWLTTPQQRREILDRLGAGESPTVLAKAYGISRAAVYALRNRAEAGEDVAA